MNIYVKLFAQERISLDIPFLECKLRRLYILSISNQVASGGPSGIKMGFLAGLKGIRLAVNVAV